MKTVLALNGSPRRDGNTAQLLRQALGGAAQAGADTEFIHLPDLSYAGCVSCFGCKRLGSPKFATCCWQDDLTPVLEKMRKADGVLIGAPIYFGDVTGMVRNLTERILFPNCLYDKDGKTAYDKRVPVGFVYTMNCPDASIYDSVLEQLAQCYGRFLGPVRDIRVVETLQFDDYSKYSSSMFDVAARKKRREEHFPLDLEAAFQLGLQLMEQA